MKLRMVGLAALRPFRTSVLAGLAVLFGLVGLAGFGGLADAQETKIPFERLAQEYLEAHGLAGRTPDTIDFLQVLEDGSYARLSLGTFDLYCPKASLADKAQAESVLDAIEAVTALQRVWLQWTSESDAALADLDSVAKWIHSLSARKLAKLDGDTPDLYELLGAKDDVKGAAARLRTAVESGVKSVAWDGGFDRKGIDVTRILFTPTREDYIRHVAFTGWHDATQRAVLWDDSMVNRTSAWCGRTQLVPLEYAAWPVDVEKPFAGSSMNLYDKTGLEQQVVDRASISLMRDVYYYYGAHFFESALASNLVIAACGRNRVGFSYTQELRRAGGRTEEYSRFVPGGNPAGGTLPPRKAQPGPLMAQISYISQWHEDDGSDYFAKCLRESQKAGAKLAGKDKDNPLRADKAAHFELRNETGDRYAVTAPFLGRPAEGKQLPPDALLDDYEEFFRAYRCAFFHWLQGNGTSDAPGEQFAELIRAQAQRKPEEDLSIVVERVYGLPLSTRERSEESLEWRFLDWLAKR